MKNLLKLLTLSVVALLATPVLAENTGAVAWGETDIGSYVQTKEATYLLNAETKNLSVIEASDTVSWKNSDSGGFVKTETAIFHFKNQLDGSTKVTVLSMNDVGEGWAWL